MIGFCILLGLAAMIFSEIPRPMSPLEGVVLTGRATVKNEWTVDKMFGGRNSTSSVRLAQPVQYVPLEFVPEERQEPVVAVDNIDAGSIPNLKVGQIVDIRYEQADPRNARLVAATRTFWNKNLGGLMIDGVVWIVLGGVALVLWGGLSRWVASGKMLPSSQKKPHGQS